MHAACDRLPVLLLSLALVAGCGGGDAEPTKDTPPATKADTPEPAAAEPEIPETRPTPPPKPQVETPAEKPAETKQADPADTSADAIARLRKFGGMRHLPAAYGYEKLSLESTFQVPMFGPTSIKLKTDWQKGGKPLGIDVELPQQVAEQMPEMVPMVETMVGMTARLLLGHLFQSPDAGLDGYTVKLGTKKERSYVEMVPKDEPMGFERRRLFFGDDGLVEQELFTLHVDGEDPNMAQYVGVEFDMSFEYLKQGDRYLIAKLTTSMPTGEATASMEYYELPKGVFLPKTVTVETAMAPQPITFELVNYTVDGAAVEATKPAEKPKPETPKVPEVPKDE